MERRCPKWASRGSCLGKVYFRRKLLCLWIREVMNRSRILSRDVPPQRFRVSSFLTDFASLVFTGYQRKVDTTRTPETERTYVQLTPYSL